MSGPLTPPQNTMLACIRVFIDHNGYSPTTRELMILGGWKSTSSVSYHLHHLRRLGVITYNQSPRTIRIVERG